MDNRPIGVFDSGLGGLTAMRKLVEAMPNEDLIYLGDTGRVPYGGRSKDTIIKYARQDIEFLLGHDIKAIVVACGTVSTVALEQISGEYDTPIFGVVEPTAWKAAKLTASGRIGIIGTVNSVNSGAYDRAIQRFRPGSYTFSKACPLFVPLVENGRVNRGDRVIELVVEEYLSELREQEIDTLILGCTHYPLLSDVISDFMGSGVKLVSPGEETAEYLIKKLRQADALAQPDRPGRHRYYVTDSTEGFERLASLFMDSDISGEVSQTELF
ncbi:MAG: glutamate racemase [Clostridiales bacterium]|nr:glutamate racemase [Clostridiales bacterium]